MLARARAAVVAQGNLTSFLFVLPALVIFAVFYVYPFLNMVFLSFHEWRGIGPLHFIGLQNYQEIVGDRLWWNSMAHAGYITLIALTFQNALAFGLALACDREIRMKRFYRLVFFIPPVLSEVVVGLMGNWILNPGLQNGQHIGLLNHLLYSSGFPQLVNNWLGDPRTALTTIAIVHSWKGFGWGFIMLLVGLQTIDKQLYEAARVDGASAWKAFVHITVPMMLPVILVVMILTILGSMQVFVLILSMVNEGLVNHTDVPATYILTSMIGNGRFGYACAQAVIFGVILVGVSFIMKRMSDWVKRI
ncbi:MAG: sugar ABC transporter permease [Candidatus Omnitrophica bacterium]|nr:sugar ABC transporter permease [Candidatus Omnitrophota bacterium]